jgi:deazaflavin-dependent oxidoreductase (nitroreductase family)
MPSAATATAVRDRPIKRRFEILLGRYTLNPLIRATFRAGLTPPRTALVETVGRKTGQIRRVPVNYAREGDTLWLIAQHGPHAAWVRNFEAAGGTVRIRLGRRWHRASAELQPEDDVRARIRTLASGPVGRVMASGMFRALESHPVSVKVTLLD